MPIGYGTVGYSRVTCDWVHDERVRTRSVGENGLLLEVDDPAAWYRALVDAREQGRLTAVEIVPAASTVLLSGITDLSRTRAALESVEPQRFQADGGEVEIPIRWDGEDYEEVRNRWRESPAKVLKEAHLRVAFCGFAPGFAYVTGLAERFHIPRRETPRTKVPPGSLATAGPYVGIYPRATPGGWHLLGHTEITLLDVTKDQPALLTPNARVRFVDA
jgi:KipI family sensor histidine kinase inhibitor